MPNILAQIYHDRLPALLVLSGLEEPEIAEEGFYTGVRFGAQLMAQLLEGF